MGGALRVGRTRGGTLAVARPRVVDAHVHFWDPARLDYPWLAETPALQRAFGPKDFAPLEQGTIDALVFVEANCAHGQSLREVRWVEASIWSAALTVFCVGLFVYGLNLPLQLWPR